MWVNEQAGCDSPETWERESTTSYCTIGFGV